MPAPAGDGAVGAQPAPSEPSARDSAERARRSVHLTFVVPAPAGDGAVGAQPARSEPAARDSAERARRSVRLTFVVPAPAGDGAVGAHPARMRRAGADGAERARRSVRPAVPVVAPAGDGVVGAQPARMGPADRDGAERARRSVRLTISVVAPAGDGVVGAQSARNPPSGGDGGEGAVWLGCWVWWGVGPGGLMPRVWSCLVVVCRSRSAFRRCSARRPSRHQEWTPARVATPASQRFRRCRWVLSGVIPRVCLVGCRPGLFGCWVPAALIGWCRVGCRWRRFVWLCLVLVYRFGG